MVTQIEEYSLVSFTPLDISEEESLGTVLLTIDMTIQYGEDYDVRIPKVVYLVIRHNLIISHILHQTEV